VVSSVFFEVSVLSLSLAHEIYEYKLSNYDFKYSMSLDSVVILVLISFS